MSNIIQLSHEDIANLTRLEESLWVAETRFDNAYMNDLPSADFVELGHSGRRYERSQMFFNSSERQSIDVDLSLPDLRIRSLSANIAQVTYVNVQRTAGNAERAQRSSLWRRTTAG